MAKLTKVEIERKLKELCLNVKECKMTLDKTEASLASSKNQILRNKSDLRICKEDLSELLGRECVSIEHYIEYRQLIAESKRRLDILNGNVAGLQVAIRKQKQLVLEAETLAESVAKALSEYGKVVNLCRSRQINNRK